MSVLEKVNYPEDLRKLPESDLPLLCQEIREKIIHDVSRTGGHLASSLGAVEIAVALHYVYDTPRDQLVWDTGHQAYAHKILTGRKAAFETLRQKGGISGYVTPEESPYDTYPVGHAGTSISVALGLAAARDLEGGGQAVIAIIGDGAMTSGLALEGLNNNAGRKNFTIVLNDNAMSISPTKGAIAKHFARLVANPGYRKIKHFCGSLIDAIPFLGKHLRSFFMRLLGAFKLVFVTDNIFEKLGFHYLGPVNGNDVLELVRILRDRSKDRDMPVVLHCQTEKGLGFKPAEENPERFHGVGEFDPETGETISDGKSKGPTYTRAFSKAVGDLAAKDSRIVAVSAAMCGGTGMTEFARHYPERFFDVGIAESHAVTFAGGLAKNGLLPVVGIYSTFMQRAFDSIAHDLCLAGMPVILALDRAGLVGSDGKTHHGVFDLSYLRLLPDIKVFAPRDEAAIKCVLDYALACGGPVAIRYARRTIPYGLVENPLPGFSGAATSWQTVREGRDLCIISLGHLVFHAARAAEILQEKYGLQCRVIDACCVKPLDLEALSAIGELPVFTLEDNSVMGGFGSAVAEALSALGRKGPLEIIGVPDRFIMHGTLDELYSELGWQPEQLALNMAQKIGRG